jgi:hypothetical protein
MAAHRIPLGAVNRYFPVFFPRTPKIEQRRERFNSFFNAAGSLRIFLRKDDLIGVDFMLLVRHKERFPDFVLNIEHLLEINAGQAKGLKELVNNKHPAWMQWVRSDAISQIRITGPSQDGKLRIVVKEEQATQWMRPTLHQKPPAGYLATMGLDAVSLWEIEFGVDYS